MDLQILRKDKELIQQRRDEAFQSLLDLTSERRRLLSIINEKDSTLMQLQFSITEDKRQERMDAADMLD